MKVVAVLYPGGSAADNPEVLGCAENALGLRETLEEAGHELVSTTELEGEELEGHLRDADVLVTTPFWPLYVTKEMLGNAPNLKLILTAGVGSDHVDLGEAAERGITVAEITGSNTVSVAEHAVMQVLALVRNFVPAYGDVVDGGWSIFLCAPHALYAVNRHVAFTPYRTTFELPECRVDEEHWSRR